MPDNKAPKVNPSWHPIKANGQFSGIYYPFMGDEFHAKLFF